MEKDLQKKIKNLDIVGWVMSMLLGGLFGFFTSMVMEDYNFTLTFLVAISGGIGIGFINAAIVQSIKRKLIVKHYGRE